MDPNTNDQPKSAPDAALGSGPASDLPSQQEHLAEPGFSAAELGFGEPVPVPPSVLVPPASPQSGGPPVTELPVAPMAPSDVIQVGSADGGKVPDMTAKATKSSSGNSKTLLIAGAVLLILLIGAGAVLVLA